MCVQASVTPYAPKLVTGASCKTCALTRLRGPRTTTRLGAYISTTAGAVLRVVVEPLTPSPGALSSHAHLCCTEGKLGCSRARAPTLRSQVGVVLGPPGAASLPGAKPVVSSSSVAQRRCLVRRELHTCPAQLCARACTINITYTRTRRSFGFHSNSIYPQR